MLGEWRQSGAPMFVKALLVLTVAFLSLGALRFAAAPPRPRWMAPAAVGIVVAVLLARFGAIGVAAGVAIALALWMFPRPAAAPAPMDSAISEARTLLGVGPAATADDIRAAHRRRIADAHPDRGGAPGDAARLNAARDLLLKTIGRGRG